jgi:hypothetical protein
MKLDFLREQIETSCSHLLSEENLDVSTPTYGCFDRRFWAWKLVDMPESTFQRNILPLAWFLKQGRATGRADSAQVKEAVIAGLSYAIKIQHKDGSYDQAYINERSYGATGFLLSPLIRAYQTVKTSLSEDECVQIESSQGMAANFLCESMEQHGLISNHLAGAALSLLDANKYLCEQKYLDKSHQLIDYILKNQSSEGWFPEYDGADPGYQTLCLYYLAQIYACEPNTALKHALQKSLEFISYFVQPDGSFGGEYGSRRTAVYYPGGISLLTKDFPLACAIDQFMLASIKNGSTITLRDIDIGNLAPLLSSYILSLDTSTHKKITAVGQSLPFQIEELHVDFNQAGIYLRGNKRYYALLGVSNGGVLKIFKKKKGKLILSDCGYLGETVYHRWITTQATKLPCTVDIGEHTITYSTPFYRFSPKIQTPLKFTLLRIANLTVMRWSWINEWVKRILVNTLITNFIPIETYLHRQVQFGDSKIIVRDLINSNQGLKLRKLMAGGEFVTIHMASARYHASGNDGYFPLKTVDITELNQTGKQEFVIEIKVG